VAHEAAVAAEGPISHVEVGGRNRELLVLDTELPVSSNLGTGGSFCLGSRFEDCIDCFHRRLFGEAVGVLGAGADRRTVRDGRLVSNGRHIGDRWDVHDGRDEVDPDPGIAVREVAICSKTVDSRASRSGG
tara:strand:- start:26 stop:418 length:393 start_codon:yes stop_codon:yes gene_type:complete